MQEISTKHVVGFCLSRAGISKGCKEKQPEKKLTMRGHGSAGNELFIAMAMKLRGKDFCASSASDREKGETCAKGPSEQSLTDQ